MAFFDFRLLFVFIYQQHQSTSPYGVLELQQGTQKPPKEPSDHKILPMIFDVFELLALMDRQHKITYP